MKKQSKRHIEFVANTLLKAMIDCSKGEQVVEKNGEQYFSMVLPDLSKTKKIICKNLERLCKNVIEIEKDA